MKHLIRSAILAAFFVLSFRALADTTTWDFSTSGNYNISDPSKAEIVGGVARLRAVNQVDSNSHSADFMSDVIDVGGAVDWTALSWEPLRPYFKALPNNGGRETAYSDGNVDMSGNIFLLHLDETSAADIVDYSASPSISAGANIVGSPTFGLDGKIGKAVQFDGSATAPESLSFSRQMSTEGDGAISVEMWFYLDSLPPIQPPYTYNAYTLFVAGWQNYDKVGYHWLFIYNRNGTGELFLRWQAASDDPLPGYRCGEPGGRCYYLRERAIPVSLTTGRWYHLVVTHDYSAMTAKFYLDGSLIDTYIHDGGYIIPVTDQLIHIGSYRGYSWYLNGKIDEMAVYNRVLSEAEVVNHYNRGVQRIKFQVRSCDTADCAGVDFVGPDGTSATYYSEFQNATLGLPILSLSGHTARRYFQYKAIFEKDADSLPAPQLSSVTIGPSHYWAGNPYVTNITPAPAFEALSGFSESLSGGGNARYQISSDGTNWYYHNGTVWVAAAGYEQTNTIADVNYNISAFASEGHTGVFYFKVFLHSDGLQQALLDEVSLDWTPPPEPPPPPVACEYIYSEWGPCQPDGMQIRTVVSALPDGCVGTPLLLQNCDYVALPPPPPPPPPPPAACEYIYSEWGPCQTDNTRARSVTSSSPEGCVGTPDTLQQCIYEIPPPPPPDSGDVGSGNPNPEPGTGSGGDMPPPNKAVGGCSLVISN